MSRVAKAFWVAPLWVPLVVAPYVAFKVFPSSERAYAIVMVGIVSALFAYFGAFLLGLPAYLFLRRHNWTSPLVAAGSGFFIGILTASAFVLMVGIVLGDGFRAFWFVFEDPLRVRAIAVLAPGALGALVGYTAWRIMRAEL